MLLTITTTHQPATDIGYLLHKNPQNLHQVSLSFGNAYVFYPEVTPERCTAALLLDIDPITLVRKNTPAGESFALEQYVNDRPYVASSFMSIALNKAFGTLFSGKSKLRQALVEQSLPLEITISILPCDGGESLLRRLFEPLGYKVAAQQHILDATFPEWGNSRYFTVTLTRVCPLREFLVHLYVLIPVLDNAKHYWIGDDEVDKLLKFGEGWLTLHPEKDLITRRYLKNFTSLTNAALERLAEGQMPEVSNTSDDTIETQENILENKINLNQQRIAWVVAKLKSYHVKRIIDLGCGEGKLLQHLFKEHSFEQLTGCDVASRALEIAYKRLNIEQMSEMQQRRIQLMQTALTYRDKRLAGYDAATIIEVIEHLDLPRLEAFQHVVFEFARPALVIITTPNVEYNPLFETLPAGKLRHNDHRFEWTRQQFQNWANNIATQFGYSVIFENIGNLHATLGAPTQVGVFIRND